MNCREDNVSSSLPKAEHAIIVDNTSLWALFVGCAQT